MRIKLQHAHDEHAVWGQDGKILLEAGRATGYYFEIQADGNHETLATSEIYNTRADALHAIELVMGTFPSEWQLADETA